MIGHIKRGDRRRSELCCCGIDNGVKIVHVRHLFYPVQMDNSVIRPLTSRYRGDGSNEEDFRLGADDKLVPRWCRPVNHTALSSDGR